MSDDQKTREELLAEIADLRARLEEPEQTVAAIRAGQVDAFVVQEAAGERVYTLSTAELLAKLHLVTDALPVLISYVDHERRYRFNNRSYEKWLGRPTAEITGRLIEELSDEAAYAAVRPHLEAALAGREVRFKSWVTLADGSLRHVAATYIPHFEDGLVLGFVGLVEDVTERARMESHLHLLADAGRLLAETLDPQRMLEQVAGLAAGVFESCCLVDLLVEDGRSERAVLIRGDEARGDLQPLLDALARHPPLAGSTGSAGSAERQALESGRSTLSTLSTLPTGTAAPSSHALLTVPLYARGRLMGVWSLARAEADRPFTAEDTTVAEELVRRVALAVDSARLLQEARHASSAKDRFLATLSHELRTPLTPVLAVVSRFEEDPRLPAEARQGFVTVRRNVELEARLIDDMLDLTRIVRGKLELTYRVIDVAEVVAQALETLSAEAIAAKRLRVETDLAADDHRMWADAPRLTQVFWNLLANAVKFTPEGGAIRVRSRRTGELLEVEVEDTGVGIEPAVLPRIFHAFDQGRSETTREFGGLGLGLAISRSLVELHGGELEARSAGAGQGATFVVRLPAGLPGPGSSAAVGHNTAADDGAGAARAADEGGAVEGGVVERSLGVLLVEDHADTAEAMAELLRMMGHRVTVAGSVAAARSAVERRDEVFDLVVSDLGLPDGSGLEVMRHLSAQGLPGIALSGYGMEEDRRRSREAGFARHLTKPVDMQALQAAIREVARR